MPVTQGRIQNFEMGVQIRCEARRCRLEDREADGVEKRGTVGGEIETSKASRRGYEEGVSPPQPTRKSGERRKLPAGFVAETWRRTGIGAF